MISPNTRGILAAIPAACLTLIVATGIATPAVGVHIVNLGETDLFPASAEVIAADASQGSFGDSATSAPYTLAQSFRIDTAFTLRSIYLELGESTSADVGLQIFQVADSLAETYSDPLPAEIVLNTSFTLPTAEEDSVMQLYLDSPVPLQATSGSAGYIIQFTDPSPNSFSWNRTTSSVGNPYGGGHAYENGAMKEPTHSTPGRDFSLALSSVGPPPPPTDFFSTVAGPSNYNTAVWNTIPPTGIVAPTKGISPATNRYTVQDGHTVIANSDFAGDLLAVASGGTLQLATDGAEILDLAVDAGGTLNNVGAPSGDFALGDINAANLYDWALDGAAAFTASPGGDLFVDVELSGEGTLDFESNGAGSNMWLTEAGEFNGVIRFNGTGDEVLLTEASGFGDGTLEMNSTGANRLVYEPSNQQTGGTIIYNQPGEIQHSSSGSRLQGPDNFVANAAVTVDVSTTYSGNERRFFVGQSISGAGDITVNGTPSDPTSGSATHNEFEVGSTGEPGTLDVSPYSGTITGNNFVDMEIRHEMPNARIVINNNARLEMGHRAVLAEHSLRLGEVVVNNGGTLEVGYEEDDGHYAYQLRLTASGSRSGDLTLASGSTTQMQVNGTAPGQFDSITAQGLVTLGGELRIVVNPAKSPADGGDEENPTYVPTLGDTFDIISIAALSPAADFDANGTVGGEDLGIWQTGYGDDASGDADSDGDTDGRDFLIWQRNFGNTGSTVGSIVGTFSNLALVDPGNVMMTAGLAFDIDYVSSTLVQLKVVAAPLSAALAVPEPGSLMLLLVGVTILRLPRYRRYN